MFDFLVEKFQSTLREIRGEGRITEKNIESALRSIQLALLQADVHYQVVKQLIERVKAEALSQKVIQSITPAQQFVKIFYDALVDLFGSAAQEPHITKEAQNRWLIAGLQGSGKTTTIAKIGNFYKKQNYKPLFVSLDIYRPAAQQQLQILAKEVGVDYFAPSKNRVSRIIKDALNFAEKNGNDLIIFDTAGRLHIDKEMMKELAAVHSQIKPTQTIYVADAMTGQEAVNTAREFDATVPLDGIILTKMDSDAKGGAALSIKYVLNKPIFFITKGEKPEDLERFYPDRMASRILNMGDIVSLVEKAQQSIDEKKAREYEKKLLQNQFNLQDFLEQLKQIKAMGPLEELLKMLPGMGAMKNLSVDEKQLAHIEAIINSMTPEERAKPHIINGSRRQRIARGSGTSLQEVNALLKQFDMMKKMMKKLKKGGRFLKGLPGFGGMGLGL